MVKTVHKECMAADVHIPHMTEHSEKDTKWRDVQIGKTAGQVSWLSLLALLCTSCMT